MMIKHDGHTAPLADFINFFISLYAVVDSNKQLSTKGYEKR